MNIVSSEARVGAIFLILLIFVGGTILFMGGLPGRLGNRAYTMKAYFANVHGLDRGGEVRMSGVKIGKVTEIALTAPPRHKGKPVEVQMQIKRDVILYDTDLFTVDQAEMLGARSVTVRRSEGLPGSNLALAQNPETDNTGAGGLAGLPDTARELMNDARGIAKGINTMVSSRENQEQLRQILTNVNRATMTASQVANQGLKLATQLARMASKNDWRVADMIENLRLASGSVQRTATQIHQLVSTTPLPAQMARAGEELRAAAEDVHKTTTQARDIFTDPELRKSLDTMVADLRKASENLVTLTGSASKLVGDPQVQSDLKATMANIREATDSLKQSTDAARKLLTDPEVTGDLKATVRNARLTAERGADIAAKASKSLDRVDRTMDRLGNAVASVKPSYTRAWLGNRAALEEGLRSDFNLDIHYGQNPEDFWRVGVADIGRGERLILQKAVPLGSGRARGGILYGKVSVGYDKLWPRGSLEFDVYDPDRLTLDARGVYRLQDNWDLVVGVDQALNRNHPFIGVRRWFGEEKTPATK